MSYPVYGIASNRQICNFGGKAVPSTGIVLSTVDLNDFVSWFLQGPPVVTATRLSVAAQLTWLAKGVYLSDDFGAKKIAMSWRYYEKGGIPLSQSLALLTQSDQQYLTFDNVHQVLVRCIDVGAPSPINQVNPYAYDWTATFEAPVPWMEDINPTTMAPLSIGGSTGGVTTGFTIHYPGSVFCEPVFTIDIPNTNTATISEIKLQNTLTGEVLTINFGTPLAASTHWIITVDTANFKVSDQLGSEYDMVGAFSRLQNNSSTGTDNTFTIKVTTGSGALSGSTIAASYKSRWDFS
jgi:hypothetical protein